MQEQPELVGGGLGARGAVGGEVSFPGLDMFPLARRRRILVQRPAVAVAEVGDDEAGVGAVAAGLDAGDDAADPAPGLGGVEESLKRRTLPSLGSASKRAAVLSSRLVICRRTVLLGARPNT